METIDKQQYTLTLLNNIELSICVNKSNNFVLIGILCMAITIFLALIVSFALLGIKGGEGVSFGFIISCIVGFLCSGYLVRLYLWNKYGREVFIINKNEFVMYYDYKLFKDSYRKLYFNSIQVYFEYNGVLMNISKGICCSRDAKCNSIIYFKLDDEEITSIGEIPIEVIINIGNQLND